MKEKLSGGGSVGVGASRWSTRQASLFYRRQNNKSYRCRRIPSSFGGPKVLTDADLTKESKEISPNMGEKLNTTTLRPSSACNLKRKHGLLIKAKETSRRKTSLSSQGGVKCSKSEANLKRKSLNQDSCSRPSKRRPDTVRVVSKGVQKNADKKPTKEDCKSPLKTEVSNDSIQSQGSKCSPAKSVSSTHYKVIMTRPCSVPVVPVGMVSSAGPQKHSSVLVFKKAGVSAGVGMNVLPSNESLLSYVPSLTDGNVNRSIDDKDDQNQEEQPDIGLNQKTGMDKDKDEATSEITVSIKGEHVANIVADDFESGSAKLDIAKQDTMSDANTCDISPSCEFLVEGLETKRKKENAVSSDNEETVEAEQESKSGNITIKRSARISERRANSGQPAQTENLGCEKFPPESNVAKVIDSDYTGVNTFSKTLIHNTSNQPEKREFSTSILTQPNPVKPKSTKTSAKYTQRMSWRIQPQAAPVSNINSIGVGDIVWGKVHGHPWWPGRVLAISGIRNEETNNPWDRDAHVSWYGSNTSSIMHLHALQLFLPNFAKRHKRNKKGFYRVAVRQAQEALQAMSGTV